jgi:putative ABC transport system permease protein
MSNGFSRRLLYRLRAHPDVEAVFPVYVGGGPWKNPWTGKPRTIFILGIDLQQSSLNIPGLAESINELRHVDTCLFDAASRPEFGPVAERFAAGEIVEAEVNRRRLRIRGTVTLGASFAADGNLVLSQANFLRLFPERKAGVIDVGLVRLKPGANVASTERDLRVMVGKDLRVFNSQDYINFERDYWADATAIGFIFTQGVFMGFLVGFVIVYQILHSDVTAHLPQYATLKAMGYSDASLTSAVLYEALIISCLGYLPGILLSAFLFHLTAQATNLAMVMTLERSAQVFAITLLMCGLSGLLAIRQLRRADPADVF